MKRTGILAAIADVHGNSWALDAVLEDIERRRIRVILNLGDSVYGPLDPAGTLERLRSIAAVSVRGNQDRILLEPDDSIADSPTYQFVVGSLTAEDLAWLKGHELAPIRFGSVELCHGTLQRDDQYLIERVSDQGVGLKSPEELEQELASTDAMVVLCAHSHVPHLLRLPNGVLVVNPGSVGFPAYMADAPRPHAMQAGSPHARYAILEETATGWIVQHVAVPYDWHHAATVAQQNGRADWARWLQTGRASV